MKFTEAQLEKAFAGLLENENFPHRLGEITASVIRNFRTTGKTNLSEIPNSCWLHINPKNS